MTPIGSVLLTEPGRGIFFDMFTSELSYNLGTALIDQRSPDGELELGSVGSLVPAGEVDMAVEPLRICAWLPMQSEQPGVSIRAPVLPRIE